MIWDTSGLRHDFNSPNEQHLLPNQQHKAAIITNIATLQEEDLGVGCDALLLLWQQMLGIASGGSRS